jgi:hypothetical protein
MTSKFPYQVPVSFPEGTIADVAAQLTRDMGQFVDWHDVRSVLIGVHAGWLAARELPLVVSDFDPSGAVTFHFEREEDAALFKLFWC